MASRSSKYITWSGVGLRFLFAVILVFATYNPQYSAFHAVKRALSPDYTGSWPALVFFVVLLVIGWAIFIRATINSLGLFGTALAVALFVSFFWLLVNWGILNPHNGKVMVYMVLIGTSGVLTAGISWSHIRRRLTGQVDVDEIEHNEG